MPSEKPDLAPKVRSLPHKPGVYVYKDRLGQIIYVGKARDLRKRVSQYFHPSRRMSVDLKTQALIESIWDLETYVVKSEPESILLEGRLIKQFRPRYNISFRDDKHFLLVKVNLNDPYPRFQLTRMKKDDGYRYFGPFAHSTALRNTLAHMRKEFGLRTCRPPIPDERDYKHCLDHIIKNCSAPCVQKITRAAYLLKIHSACEFLEGKSVEMIQGIEEAMKKAAEALDFEKAARLRNTLDDIRSTTKSYRRFDRQIPTTVVPEKDMEELQKVLHLSRLPLHIECFDISNISDNHKVASMVCMKNGRPWRSAYRRYRIVGVEGQNDFASMAEVVRRRYSRLKKEQSAMPDLIVVDGGKGQLSSAETELQILGILDQPIIGLAKQREEIFLPRCSDPILLPEESGARRLLQRIRDEAHRVANGYHQLLMKRRIQESILDDCPGISHQRKMTLLRHFGSIEKIRKASVTALAEVEGISSRLAQVIQEFLDRTQSQPGHIYDPLDGDADITYTLSTTSETPEMDQ